MDPVVTHRSVQSLLRSAWTMVLLGAVLLGAPAPAAAQGWFGGIFGGNPGPRQYQQPAFPGFGYGPPEYVPPPRVRAPRRRPVVAQKDLPQPKKDASVFVDVFGDSLGQLLANGLDDALSDRPDVAIVHKAKGSTGLVTSEFYDWPKAIDTLLANSASKKGSTDKIDVAVMMIGSNDRQPIQENGTSYQLEADEWTAIYKKRVMAIDEAFRKKGIPLVWVGLPITRDSNFANDMAAFNDIYRDAAAKTGAIYVDTWEAFSDDNGAFDAYGPDINGQTVKLRSADGIHFTQAGARKLAHFVEAHIRRALDGKTPPVELPTAEAPPAAQTPAKSATPAVAAIKPEAGPIKNLNEPAAAANGELATASSLKANEDALAATTLVRGEPQAAPRGRVDDFRWTDDPAAHAGR